MFPTKKETTSWNLSMLNNTATAGIGRINNHNEWSHGWLTSRTFHAVFCIKTRQFVNFNWCMYGAGREWSERDAECWCGAARAFMQIKFTG